MNRLPPLKVCVGTEIEGLVPMIADPSRVLGVNQSMARIAFTNALADRLPGIQYEPIKDRWHQNSWTTVEDVTINPDNIPYADIEFKSPVILGENLLALQPDLDAIWSAGLETNDNCGQHVQIGRLSQLDKPRQDRYLAWQPDEIARFARLFADNLHAVMALCAPHRAMTNSCQPNLRPDQDLVDMVISRGRRDPNYQRLAQQRLAALYCSVNGRLPCEKKLFHVSPLDNFPYGSKNRAMSLDSLASKGTIEIRVRQAEGFQRSIPFINMLLHMAQAAIDNYSFSVVHYIRQVADDPLLALTPYATPSRQPARPRPSRAVAALPS